MKIIETSGNLDKRQIYKFTNGKNLVKLSECDGMQFDIESYVIYTDVNTKTNEEQELLAFATSDGDIITTNSATAMRSFRAMLEAFETVPLTDVIVVSGQSRNGRTYYDLDIV